MKAIELVEKAALDYGILASLSSEGNYHRVWTRDMVISGLSGLFTKNQKIIKSLKSGLNLILKHQGKLGQIPSNVDLEGNVSYGGLVGRVDVVSWYTIGVCKVVQQTRDDDFAKAHKISIEKALRLLEYYEFNANHLMYVPQASNWADEYILEGYVLSDQLLRLWALKSYTAVYSSNIFNDKIRSISERIKRNFIPDKTVSKTNVIHPNVYKAINKKKHRYLVAAFKPGRLYHYFDVLGNSLAVLVLQDKALSNSIIEYGEQLLSTEGFKLLPAHYPIIKKGDKDWDELQFNYKYKFSNAPYSYHNGGMWCMINMWYALALFSAGRHDKLSYIARTIKACNALENNGFYENIHAKTGTPLGVRNCTWSASAEIVTDYLVHSNTSIQTLFPELYI